MFQAKMLRGNLIVRLPFVRPMLDWSVVAPKFIKMIWDALRPTVAMQPSDFSVSPSNKLSELNARYNLYGGATNITLWADRLAFEFINLVPTDYALVLPIIQQIHDAFPVEFPSTEYNRVEVHSLRHLQLSSPEKYEEYMKVFKPNLDKPFAALSPIVSESLARFEVRNHDNLWQCKFGFEKSLLDANAIFVDVYMSLNNQTNQTPFADKVAQATAIVSTCYDTLLIDETVDA